MIPLDQILCNVLQQNAAYYEKKLFPAVDTVSTFLTKFRDAYRKRKARLLKGTSNSNGNMDNNRNRDKAGGPIRFSSLGKARRRRRGRRERSRNRIARKKQSR